MPNQKTIAAVVVTYNRSQLLEECVQGLLRQSRALDAIYVIDNNSQDGTQELMLRLAREHSKIQYVRLDSNTGGAGGFAHGLALAHQAGYSWYWLMDDDVEAYGSALEGLLRFGSRSECIHGLRTAPSGEVVEWGDTFDVDKVAVHPIRAPRFEGEDDAVEVEVGCFEGMLISHRVVSLIGYPDPEFFITWDDAYYGYLASKHTPVIYANVLSLKRKTVLAMSGGNRLKKRAMYSMLALFHVHRNRYLVARKVEPRLLIFVLESLRVYVKSCLKELLLHRSFQRMRQVHRGTLQGLRIWLS